MKNSLLPLVAVMFLGACQSNKSYIADDKKYDFSNTPKRGVANSGAFRLFLGELSSRTGRTMLEHEAVAYISRFEAGSGNWARAGLTEAEAKGIKNIFEETAAAGKLRKFIQENAHVVYGIDRKIAAESWEFMAKGRSGYINPYQGISQDVTQSVIGMRNTFKPTQLSYTATDRVKAIYKGLPKEHTGIFDRTLEHYKLVGANDLATRVNGHLIVESNANITRVTGLKSTGEGCLKHLKDPDVISNKASVDMKRWQLVEERAITKAQIDNFKSYNDIPANKRVVASELDELTELAAREELHLTAEEAKVWNQYLKKQCDIY